MAAVMIGTAALAGVDALRGEGGGGRDGVEVRRAGSAPARGEVELDPAAAAVRAYRITYRVNDLTGVERRVQWAVRRPFDSRSVERGEGFTTVDETAFARAARAGTRVRESVFAVPPRSPDHRPLAVLADALAAGLVDEREVRIVARHRCRVYRSGGTLDRLAPPASRTYTDTCIDERGLILEEWRVEEGRPVQHRVALEVEVDTAAAAAAARPELTDGATVPTSVGGGDVKEVRSDSMTPGAFFVLDVPPAGFSPRGRYAVVPAQAQLGDPSRGQQDVIASTADVFVRDETGDFVVVDQGGTLGKVEPFAPSPHAVPADLGAELGPGEALLGWAGAEVRVARGGGRFVRVYGTVPVADLAAVARSLRRTDGGTGLVYL